MTDTADPVRIAVSVVVATHNRARLLPRLVEALQQQTEQHFELIVVDDASADDTPAVLDRLQRDASIPVVPLRLPTNSGPATARNLGWQTARAPFIAFTDDDCLPQPQWVAAMLRRLEEAEIVQGRTVPDPAQRPYRGDFSHTVWVEEQGGWYETCNMGYRRTVLEKVDGFDQSFRYPYGEDTDLAWRAIESGAQAVFESDALVFHEISASRFRERLRRNRREDGAVHVLSRHPGVRAQLPHPWLYRRHHGGALLTAAALALALARPRGSRISRWAPVAVALGVYLKQRPLHTRRRYKPLIVPLVLAADLHEVGVLASASIRHRTFLL